MESSIKLCRICWNTSQWQQPTSEARHLESKGSFVSDKGFGHEEWIFNFDWLYRYQKQDANSYKYGYLQPISKFLSKYEGRSRDIILYTISPKGERLAVAHISEAYVPKSDEINFVFESMKRDGCLGEMEENLKRLGIEDWRLNVPPSNLINVRFRPENVHFFDPVFELQEKNVGNRYHPYDFFGHSFLLMDKKGDGIKFVPRNNRAEEDRYRPPIEGMTYSPRHSKLQNNLFSYLKRIYGENNVFIEQNGVDVVVRHEDALTFYEIKIANTVRSCIRQAIGQLLEYGYYGSQPFKIKKFVIVGEGAPTTADIEYMTKIRKITSLPLHYAMWRKEGAHLHDLF